MIKTLKLLSFFSLIQALISFAPVSVLLFIQTMQDLGSRNTLFNLVITASAIAALCSLLLLIAIGIDLYGKRFTARTDTQVTFALILIGLSFCGIAAYAFLVSPTVIADNFYLELDRIDSDFFRRFIFSARLEFLLIGLPALVMSAMKIHEKSTSL
jgi:hypothetical protein